MTALSHELGLGSFVHVPGKLGWATDWDKKQQQVNHGAAHAHNSKVLTPLSLVLWIPSTCNDSTMDTTPHSYHVCFTSPAQASTHVELLGWENVMWYEMSGWRAPQFWHAWLKYTTCRLWIWCLPKSHCHISCSVRFESWMCLITPLIYKGSVLVSTAKVSKPVLLDD